MWPFIGGAVAGLALVFTGEYFSKRSFSSVVLSAVGATKAAIHHAEATAANLHAKADALKAKLAR